MKSLILSMFLFLAISLGSIGLMFQPVRVHSQDVFGNEFVGAPAATSVNGLALRAQAWREYPTYNIGLGIIAVMAFTGAIVTASKIVRRTE